MTPGQIGRLRHHALLWTSIFALVAHGRAQADGGEKAGTADLRAWAAATFQSRCTACHTYGKGVKVGPDLKGVTERRQRAWLVRFIRGSSALIASGDRTAAALFAEFKQQRMPDWTEFSEEQIHGILDYLGAGGPDVRPLDERSAEYAAPADVELGRRLFDGRVRFADGRPPCSSCHTARGSAWLEGGSLGPDLSTAYLDYQDKALTSFLRHPCFRWDPSFGGERAPTAAESFAVKAFLLESALLRRGAPVRVSGSAAVPRGARETPATAPARAAASPPPAPALGDERSAK
jgi:mono/diheme cytochrome c family protein